MAFCNVKKQVTLMISQKIKYNFAILSLNLNIQGIYPKDLKKVYIQKPVGACS